MQGLLSARAARAGAPANRPPAVAGSFYPDRAEDLRREVRRHLAQAPQAAGPAPKALIVPHAGYIYCGPTAGCAYARLAGCATAIERVVLLGPAHRAVLRGLALATAPAFDTPLGAVTLDRAAIARIADLPQVSACDRAHANEHSLEVQLPFLQQVLGRFTLVPLAVGEATPQQVAEALERLWGGPETLIVVSSDLSHGLPYAAARAVDRATVEAMLALNPALDPLQACGAAPVNGLLLAAARHGLRAELLDLRNSGDTAGDRSHVVGYAALALYEPRAAAQP